MKAIKSVLETEAIFSEDKMHRYLLKKTWDIDKEVLTIITMYPHYDGVINVDLTTQLIINKVAEKDEYGGVNFINLFSNIDTPINLKHIENSHDKHTDIHIMKAVKEADNVLLAWGSYMYCHLDSLGTQKIFSAKYSSLSSSSAYSSFNNSSYFSSKESETYFKNIIPNATFLYSAASMLPRNLSAACHNFSSNPIVAMISQLSLLYLLYKT